MNLSVDALVEILRFYARGGSDGGKKASEALVKLQQEISRKPTQSFTAVGKLVEEFSKALKQTYSIEYSPEPGDEAVLATSISKIGFVKTKELLVDNLGRWRRTSFGAPTIRNILQSVPRRLV